MTDKEITGLFWQRSENAIRESQAKYGGLVRHVISGILHDTLDIEECENDTFLSAWQSIPPHEPRSLKAYLASIARNTAYKRAEYLSAAKRKPEALLSLDELAETLADARTEDCSDTELSGIINGFLAKLRPEQRKVFLLRYWAGLSTAEIAGRTGLPKSKVDMMLHRLRRKLHDDLQQRGYCYDK
ncbi:MAG: sigma-70 family RNA polymerase sigma factor [Oscillospiraceae bacterium]|nr:sigma-70 family RNA polymerase sigma factor [Oscillospiraceae bacterium]